MNCLANVPLLLIAITVDASVLYQFTMPRSIIAQVGEAMQLENYSASSICQALKTRLESHPSNASNMITVTCKTMVLDRVAM
jgi:hypothetical protein